MVQKEVSHRGPKESTLISELRQLIWITEKLARASCWRTKMCSYKVNVMNEQLNVFLAMLRLQPASAIKCNNCKQ